MGPCPSGPLLCTRPAAGMAVGESGAQSKTGPSPGTARDQSQDLTAVPISAAVGSGSTVALSLAGSHTLRIRGAEA